ncbi:unnamed protein product, partial [Rotaria sordida]
MDEKKEQLQSKYLQFSQQMFQDPANHEIHQQMEQIRNDLIDIENKSMSSSSSLSPTIIVEEEEEQPTNETGLSVQQN